MPIGNTFPIYLRLSMTAQITTLPSLKGLKVLVIYQISLKYAFGITSLTGNGILKTDSKGKAGICNRQSNQPSHAKATLTRPQKGLVRFPPWGHNS